MGSSTTELLIRTEVVLGSIQASRVRGSKDLPLPTGDLPVENIRCAGESRKESNMKRPTWVKDFHRAEHLFYTEHKFSVPAEETLRLSDLIADEEFEGVTRSGKYVVDTELLTILRIMHPDATITTGERLQIGEFTYLEGFFVESTRAQAQGPAVNLPWKSFPELTEEEQAECVRGIVHAADAWHHPRVKS